MHIYSAAQIHEWDQYTITNEPISSDELMERAAGASFKWLMNNGYEGRSFTIFCGKGNNGGDGLVISRQLAASGHTVEVYIPEFGLKGTDDFQLNLGRLHDTAAVIRFVPAAEQLRAVPAGHVIIDALFGSGLNRKPDGLNLAIIEHLNNSNNEIIAVDIPSGMSADHSSVEHAIIRAAHTLTFQVYKLAFLVSENEQYCGIIHLLDIGLNEGFHQQLKASSEIVSADLVRQLYRPRKNSGHKGTYGHSLVVAGSYGKMGAAMLAARACLHSGTGLCSVHVPACGYQVMQLAAPEAMTETDAEDQRITGLQPGLEKYSCIGVGPGIGRHPQTAAMVENLLQEYKKPLVIDADALNILSDNPGWLSLLPAQSVLTPHPKEFERLFGKRANDFERIELAAQKASELNLVIILKGHRTLITDGDHKYFNSTGNAGMASGGTGDTLTGIITALVAQQYPPLEAAILGVYLHGLAGDQAAREHGMEYLLASDIIRQLGKAFKTLQAG